MADAPVLKKYELERKLGEENALIKSGVLRDENPLDASQEFHNFLLACRRGDLKSCQEHINQGVNINGKDEYDYTPLIIASLCGHFELVQLLLESGALAERNTFQGERCLYNALNDRIRNLLLKYDFSKSSDPYVYWSTHISSLLNRTVPDTSDITLTAGSRSFNLHKFYLASRTSYFKSKLQAEPGTTQWRLSSSIPREAFEIVIRYVYLGDLPKQIVAPGSHASEEDVMKSLDKMSRDLGIEHLWEAILGSSARREARQRHEDEVKRAITQVSSFFEENVLGHKMVVDTDRVNDVKWKHDNSIFADVLLRADSPPPDDDAQTPEQPLANGATIPVGPLALSEPLGGKSTRKSTIYPVHKAMLIRSEYFATMFSSEFLESNLPSSPDSHLHIITVDCTPEVLELILAFMYTETARIPLELALDLLYAADMLFLDDLKTKAAQAISTLGSGSKSSLSDRTHVIVKRDGNVIPKETDDTSPEIVVEMEPINVYDIIHAAWDLRVQRLEEFSARYLASRLEDYIDEPEFADLIAESASRLKNREETDTIELLDDIRYYLDERFRLRFEEAGLEEIMEEETEEANSVPAAQLSQKNGESDDKAVEGVKAATGSDYSAPPAVAEDKGGSDPAEDSQDRVKTLDGQDAEDEFSGDAINYHILLGKIDSMLDRLKLDA